MPDSRIREVRARQLLDCKTRPMVEVEVVTRSGHVGRGAAPTGTSVGMYEAVILRDEGTEYGGLGVRRAVSHVVEVIGPRLVGMRVEDQRHIDQTMLELDGTERKSRLGGNAIYSTSIAVLRAAAAVAGEPVYRYISKQPLTHLPVPCFNMVNGGRYPDLVQPFNEFLLVPYRAGTIERAVEMAVRIFGVLGELIAEYTGQPARVGGSYGYVAQSHDPRIVLDLMMEAAARAGHADEVALALDCASSEMYDEATNTYLLMDERVPAYALIDFAEDLTQRYDLVFIEDLLDENDWAGFVAATARLTRTIVMADDLTVTNRSKLERAVRERAAGGFILKPNQVGTITEALDAFEFATRNDLIAIPSGRSGGVIDDIVMDLSVGLQVPLQKNGAPRSGERIEKLNFLMRAAQDMGSSWIANIPTVTKRTARSGPEPRTRLPR
jgi:enolase